MSKETKIPMEQKLVVGAVAGVIGTSAIFPIDVVKTRLQVCLTQAQRFSLLYHPHPYHFSDHECLTTTLSTQNQTPDKVTGQLKYRGLAHCTGKHNLPKTHVKFVLL